MTLQEMENKFIMEVLQKNNNNKSKTARELNITRKTLLKKLKAIALNSVEILKLPENSNDESKGYFYIFQLSPSSLPNRIKLGYSSNLSGRLKSFQTANPSCKILQFYPCKKQWEKTIIDRLSTIPGCSPVKNEVFDFHFIDILLDECDKLFNNLPHIMF